MHSKDLAPFSEDFASQVAGSGNAALSLRHGLASADTGGRNAAFPWALESCHLHPNLPEKASFSKAVALQIRSPVAIDGGIQHGASHGFPTVADVGLPHQRGAGGVTPCPWQLPMAGGTELIYHPTFPLSHDCSWLCQRPA